MSLKAKASFDFCFGSASSAMAASAALEGESGFSRARIGSTVEGTSLVIDIDADDVVALRAAANGVLRNLQVFESIEKT